MPHTLDEALAFKAQRPEAIPLAGGTDLMVDLNFGRLRPTAIVDLSQVGELAVLRQANGEVFLGAGVTYATIVKEMTTFKPLVQASRSVGSPQIANSPTCPASASRAVAFASSAVASDSSSGTIRSSIATPSEPASATSARAASMPASAPFMS